MRKRSRCFAKNKPVIAVDFDGCIVENDFPEIGPLKEGAIEALREFKEAGWTIILWTCRDGDFLKEAVDFIGSNGIEIDYINEDVEFLDFTPSRKVVADVYIDDLNLDWSDDWQDIRDKVLAIYDKRKN